MEKLLEIKQVVRDYLAEKGIDTFFGDTIDSRHQKLYINFEKIDEYDTSLLKEYFFIFKDEFDKYSREFLKKVKIKSVNFVKNLNVDNSGTKKFISISATVDSESSSLILDIDHASNNENYDRQCIHHELFHLIDFNMYGTFVYNDPEWLKLNPPQFDYGKGGWTAYFDKEFKNKKHPQEGFVTEYAMRSIDEDRAETFMYVMTEHLRNDLNDWIKNDDILNKKVEHIKNNILN